MGGGGAQCRSGFSTLYNIYIRVLGVGVLIFFVRCYFFLLFSVFSFLQINTFIMFANVLKYLLVLVVTST